MTTRSNEQPGRPYCLSTRHLKQENATEQLTSRLEARPGWRSLLQSQLRRPAPVRPNVGQQNKGQLWVDS